MRGKIGQLPGMWRGRTVACIASGPSLTQEDCDAVHAAGLPTIVVNTTFRMAPWADILYAMDSAWWKHYGAEVAQNFGGMKFSYVQNCGPDVTALKGTSVPTSWGNSGAGAIGICVSAEAAKVLLLGFDCQWTGGRKHWHGDHPEGMGNATSVKRWPAQFSLVAKVAKHKGVRVVNCSRETALTCFTRGQLERELDITKELERV